MRMPYHPLPTMLLHIEGPQLGVCKRILQENEDRFKKAPGSRKKHHAWPGGYWDHITEVMNLIWNDYRSCSALRPLPFTLSDALVVGFVHDLEKPWKYIPDGKGGFSSEANLATKDQREAFRLHKIAEYGLVLTAEQLNGLKYAEGEGKDYDPDKLVMGPLAALVHVCDVISSRIWFNHPLPQDDPWRSARRISAEPMQ